MEREVLWMLTQRFLPPISNYLVHPRALPPICDWAEDDRPREKLLHKGAGALSHAELLAILIHSGNRELSAVSLAQSILLGCGNDLSELGRLGLYELTRFTGIGAAKAATIIAAMELGRRRQTAALSSSRTVLYNSADAAALLKPLLEDQPCETFYAVYLNHANKVLGHSCISTGGRTSTTVDPGWFSRRRCCTRPPVYCFVTITPPATSGPAMPMLQ